MNTTHSILKTTWLKTDDPVIPINSAAWDYLPEVETALRHGVEAVRDDKRPGFYEIELDKKWFYVHVPSRFKAVYLVAAQNRVSSLVAEPAC